MPSASGAWWFDAEWVDVLWDEVNRTIQDGFGRCSREPPTHTAGPLDSLDEAMVGCWSRHEPPDDDLAAAGTTAAEAVARRYQEVFNGSFAYALDTASGRGARSLAHFEAAGMAAGWLELSLVVARSAELSFAGYVVSQDRLDWRNALANWEAAAVSAEAAASVLTAFSGPCRLSDPVDVQAVAHSNLNAAQGAARQRFEPPDPDIDTRTMPGHLFNFEVPRLQLFTTHDVQTGLLWAYRESFQTRGVWENYTEEQWMSPEAVLELIQGQRDQRRSFQTEEMFRKPIRTAQFHAAGFGAWEEYYNIPLLAVHAARIPYDAGLVRCD